MEEFQTGRVFVMWAMQKQKAGLMLLLGVGWKTCFSVSFIWFLSIFF